MGALPIVSPSSTAAASTPDLQAELRVPSAEEVIAAGVSNITSAVAGLNDGEEVWYSGVSLERAVGLLSLPKVVCTEHPTEGGAVEVAMGRFGPFVRHGER